MLLSSITLRNLLSFKDTSLQLGPLNVLIGPNGSGKSNFIEAVGLLHGIPVDLDRTIREGGGVREWIWRGDSTKSEVASLECTVTLELKPGPYLYRIDFVEQQGLYI